MDDYAVFAIIEGLKGIPLLIEKSYFLEKKWKLPGGRKEAGEFQEETLMREVFEEINLIVHEPDKEFFCKHIKNNSNSHNSHNFIVMVARYYNGEIVAKNEIKCVELFSKEEIRNMISNGNILPSHAEALEKYLILYSQ